MAYSLKDLLAMSQPELDALFNASPVGDIPSGEGKGTALIAPGTVVSPDIAEFISVFGWQGKIFDPASGTLRNEILPFGLRAVIAKVYKGVSWFNGGECIILDYSDTSLIAHWLRDELRLIGTGQYLGKVFFGRSHVFDFVLQF